ncbi:MAG: T9SS type A sorting domain-containing protein [Flavisolibacter sp.]
MKTSVHFKNSNKNLLSLALGLMLAFSGLAQTYTTRADGNWSSPATWVNGQVPSRIISSSKKVNIYHNVNCNVNGDLNISGQLNIVGATLTFPSSFQDKTIINASGSMTIINGAYLQHMQSKKNEMIIYGGRVVLDKAIVEISKSVSAFSKTRRLYRNSTVRVGDTYTIEGTASNPVMDSIQGGSLETGMESAGTFTIKAGVNFRVANAIIIVNNGDFKLESGSSISVLPTSAGNYGFNSLKVEDDLESAGSWDARIDAHCIEGNITGSNMAAIDFTRVEDCVGAGQNASISAPELVFTNPVLKQGPANKEGAVYRFANVTTGIDAEIKLKKFSRNDIVMKNIDNGSLGWGKAFQPEFGLVGVVQPWQNWYIDFEMTFFEAGTNKKRRVSKFDLTALDVDGDGNSVSEYAIFDNPTSIIYSTVSYLTNQSAGLAGQSFTCPADGLLSPLLPCVACLGDGKSGLWNIDICTTCDGVGLKYTLCSHPYDGVNGSTVTGPVENFVNIDTLATQVMATYQYVDKDRISFRYGGKSGARSSNGSGVRLNSLWFRQFSMTSHTTLPVKLTNFTATLDNKNVTLSWTGHEENFSHYVLQSGTDGKTFSDVATVFASGNQGSASYKYTDANVSSATGTLFYRLRLVDKTEEAVMHSDVKVIRLNKEEESLKLATYPNPVMDQLKLTLPSSWQGKPVMIELYSANGVRIQAIQLGSASQTETLQMSRQAKGVYLVKAICNDETAEQRVIKN